MPQQKELLDSVLCTINLFYMALCAGLAVGAQNAAQRKEANLINFFKRIAASEFAEEDGNAKPAVVAVVLLAAVILLVLAVIFKDQISALFAPDPNFEPNPNFPVGLESQ